MRPLQRRRPRRGFKEIFAAEVLSEIDALVGGPVEQWDFEAIELAARREALRLPAVAVARRLNTDRAGSFLPCPRCATAAQYAGRRDKLFSSVLGELTLGRAYYYCQRCHRGFCPVIGRSASRRVRCRHTCYG